VFFKKCVLETSKGSLWSSNAISRYFINTSGKKSLYGSNDFEVAHQDCFLEYLEETFHALRPFIGHATGFVQTKPTKPELKTMQDALDSALPFLNTLLEEHTFLTGDRITLSDITLTLLLKTLYETHFEDADRKKYRNVTRWFLTMINQKEVKNVIGSIKLKEAKKEVVSTLDMETWKRVYMNSEDSVSIEYLWKNIDIKVNSMWICDYKDYKDLEVLYKTRNLASGVAQRAQEYAKTTFGIILICGNPEGEHTIKCMWLFESKTIPKEIQEGIDYDSYTWRRAEWKKDKDRQELEIYLKQEGELDGLKIIEGKTFR